MLDAVRDAWEAVEWSFTARLEFVQCKQASNLSKVSSLCSFVAQLSLKNRHRNRP